MHQADENVFQRTLGGVEVVEPDAGVPEVAQQTGNAGALALGIVSVGQFVALIRKFEIVAGERSGKRLTVHLQGKLDTVPVSLAPYNLELCDGGHALIYDYDTKGERTGITSLLSDLRTAGIRISDLDTSQSSLEDIFVSLVRAP